MIKCTLWRVMWVPIAGHTRLQTSVFTVYGHIQIGWTVDKIMFSNPSCGNILLWLLCILISINATISRKYSLKYITLFPCITHINQEYYCPALIISIWDTFHAFSFPFSTLFLLIPIWDTISTQFHLGHYRHSSPSGTLFPLISIWNTISTRLHLGHYFRSFFIKDTISMHYSCLYMHAAIFMSIHRRAYEVMTDMYIGIWYCVIFHICLERVYNV